MHRGIGLVVALLLCAASAAAQKVYVDYDRSVDFNQYTSFAWGPTIDLAPDLRDTAPLAHAWLKNAIEYYLVQGGLVEDEENPDVKVTYYTDEYGVVQFQVVNAGYNYGPGWYWDPLWGPGMGATSFQTNVYDKGTLVIDIWDTKTKQAIWRGTATGSIKENPTKMTKQIDKIVEKMVKKFRKMREKEQ